VTPAKADILQVPEGQFADLYRRLTGGRRVVAEAKADAAPETRIREKIVRCLWFDQFIDLAELRTEDGRKLAVFSPGYWNEGAGPDFRNAEIALGHDARLRGDVEVHVDASDWRRHGHRGDPAYRRVVLHVVLHNDVNTPTVRHGDRAIPQLALAGQLSDDLHDIIKSVDPDGYPRVGVGREGACCRSLRAYGRDSQWVGRFLDIAGDERILLKAARFESSLKTATPDAAMHDALMDAMGYSRHRKEFRRLAAAVPLQQLRRLVPADAGAEERRCRVRALLFGAAGFLEAVPADPESEAYLAALRTHWTAAAKDLPGPFMARSDWRFGRTRPTNHPVRRIAGIAAFLAAHLHTGLCRAMMTAVEHVPETGSETARCRKALERCRALFESAPDDYWARRVAFGPPTLAHATRLIGPARATEIVVNVVVPLLLALSRGNEQPRIERRLHNLYCSLKPRTENAVTRYMKSRLFGLPEAGDKTVASIRRQQGLLQLFHDFCESEASTCSSCGFLAAVEARAG